MKGTEMIVRRPIAHPANLGIMANPLSDSLILEYEWEQSLLTYPEDCIWYEKQCARYAGYWLH